MTSQNEHNVTSYFCTDTDMDITMYMHNKANRKTAFT